MNKPFSNGIIALVLCALYSLSPQILAAQNGLLYGMTTSGGDSASDRGTIFTFDPSNNTFQTRIIFGAQRDCAGPHGSFVYDESNGLFYGMTFGGGDSSFGTIISFDPLTGSDSIVWRFNNRVTDGISPAADLVYDNQNGMLYGMTLGGGATGNGTLVGFNPATGRDSLLVSFSGPDGSGAASDLAYDPNNGMYYGVSASGGAYDSGLIFKFDPSTNIKTTVCDVHNALYGPTSTLVFASGSGLFYGTCADGGTHNRGSIFSFDPVTNNINPLYDFRNTGDGANPLGSLVLNPLNGNYYCLTDVGGNYGAGSIIEFDPLTNTDSLKWSFSTSDSDGYYPYGSLLFDPAMGLFYGMTSGGGVDDVGTIFSFNPANGHELVVWNFVRTGPFGPDPWGSLTLPGNPSAIPAVRNYPSINIFPNPGRNAVKIAGATNGSIIELFNCLGQRINRYVAVGNSEQLLDITAYQNGIYLVQITGSDGLVITQQKLVKID